MTIEPIPDGQSNFDNVILVEHTKGFKPSPYCKLHGAMNKVSSFEGGGYWRCVHTVSKNNDNCCRTGCIERK